jgi:translation initiation factor IF-2
MGPVRPIPTLTKKPPAKERGKAEPVKPGLESAVSQAVTPPVGTQAPPAEKDIGPAIPAPAMPGIPPVEVSAEAFPPTTAVEMLPADQAGLQAAVAPVEETSEGAPGLAEAVPAAESEAAAKPGEAVSAVLATPEKPTGPAPPAPGVAESAAAAVEEPPPPAIEPEPVREAKPPVSPTVEELVAEKRAPVPEQPPAIMEKRGRADRADGAERPLPGIIIAPIPQAKKGTLPPKEETPVLKPEIRLTPEALRRLKGTRRPLSEYLRRLHSPEKLAELDKAVARLAAGEETPPAEQPATRPARERVKERLLEKEKAREKEKEKAKPVAREPVKPRRGARPEIEEEPLEKELRPSKRKPTPPKVRPAVEEEEEEPVAPTVPITLRRQKKSKAAPVTAPRKTSIVLELPCTVRSFSEAAGVPVHVVLAKLMELGVSAKNINSSLDQDMAELLAAELGLSLQIRAEVDPEEKLRELYDRPDDPAELLPRAPVVTFLGHVDHGKTSLLDRILGTNVASGERGGITQHIRAYRIFKDGRPITFVDTPGHEAFTAMRARGAQVTDIAVLVVACDDGVMPQTEEAIAHIRAAGVPMVVALNKIDLPGVQPDRVLQQLAAVGVLCSQWGGDVEVVQTSALTGQGIDELLEILLTVAELHELKANPNRPAVGVCLEASVQAGRGVVAKFLVKKGTLRVGDVVLCGAAHGRLKAMFDTLDPNVRYEEAGPSTPVDVIGLDSPPEAGERFYVLEDIAEARRIAEERAKRDRARELVSARPRRTLEEVSARLGSQEKVEVLHLILRADVRGSLEAILKELAKLQHPEVKIEVLQAAVGAITEGDVELANASDAIIIGFNVAPTDRALALAEQYGVQIRRYEIIYELAEDLKAALEGLLKPEIREVDIGRAQVLKLFPIRRVGTVAGCRVVQGVISRDARVRIIRDGRVIGHYAIQSLRREKDDVREVREGFECGIKLANFDDIKEGDIFEAYRLEEVRRRLE